MHSKNRKNLEMFIFVTKILNPPGLSMTAYD
ncbi:hypothetical protein NIES970_27780 (plasmid) [[Synechococcus] sp. NIES-970]|nr:hypothetical protein NIES970_27780 [[Synechococcus] sp. NIES-970]